MLTRKTPLRRSGKPIKRSRIRQVSKKRRAKLDLYSPLRKTFLTEHPLCEVWLGKRGWRWRTFNAELGALYERTSAPYYAIDFNDLALRIKGAPESVEVHHKAGRLGSNFLDTKTWLAVSREEHEWVHAHASEARARGWLV